MSKIPRIPAKKALIAAVIIGALGIAGGFYLMQSMRDVPPPPPIPAPIPSTDMPSAPVLMSVAEAKAKYDAEQASGSVALQTAKLLADAYVRESNAAAALEVYDAFLVGAPDNLAAIEARSDLLQGLGREDEYKSVLEMLAEKEPTEARLLKLSGYLNGRKLYTEQMAVLEKLNALTNRQNPEYMLAWADVALAAENPTKALELFKEYQSLPGVVIGVDRASMYTSLLVANNKKEDALNFAVQWTKTNAKEPQVVSSAATELASPPAIASPASTPLSPVPAVPPPSEEATAARPLPLPGEGLPVAVPIPVPPPVPAPIAIEETKMSAVVEELPPLPSIAPPPEVPSAVGAFPALQNAPVDVPSPLSAPAPATPAPATPATAETVASPVQTTTQTTQLTLEPTVMLASALLYGGAAAETLKYLEAVGASPESSSNDIKHLYAQAYSVLGQHSKALPIIKGLRTSGMQLDELYYIALANSARKDESLRPELKTMVLDQFNAGNLSDAQKMDRVYAMLGVGDKVVAIDLAERGMQSAGNDTKANWSTLYKSLTAPPAARMASGPRKAAVPIPSVSLDRRIAMATTGNVSEGFTRSAAFEALSAGRKDDAVKLFALLATRNGPKSNDANQLMYILGARIGQAEMAWLTTAANQSKGEDRAGWIETIANHAPAEGIVAAGEVNPQWLAVPAFKERYISSLNQLKEFERLNRLGLSTLAAQGGGPVAGSRLALIMEAEKAMAKARYKQASEALAQAIAANSSAASDTDAAREAIAINFYSAYLHRLEGNTDESRRGFEKVVDSARGLLFEDRGTQVKLLMSQMEIGDTEKARRGFETLLNLEGADESLLADYISVLLDKRLYKEARTVAQVYGAPLAARGRMGSERVAEAVPVVADGNVSPQGFIAIPTSSLSVIQPMAGGRELRLQFRSPLPQGFEPEGAASKPSWLSYYTTSYDSIVIGAANGYLLNTTPDEGMVRIGAVAEALDAIANPAATASSAMTASDSAKQSYLRLQMLYARTELESGEVDLALNRLNAMRDEYHASPEFKAYQASAELFASNPKRALSLIKDAQRLDPTNEGIRKMRRDMERFHAEHLKLDHEWFKLGSTHQHITTLEARSQFESGYEISARLQNNRIDTGFLRSSKGPIREEEESKQRAEISIAKFMDDSTVLEGKIFGNNDTPGAGISYQFPNSMGVSTLYAEYHKPYWDMPEAVVADAVRDRVGASHWWKPDPDWAVRVETAYNRYHVENKSSIGDSVAAQLNVLHTIEPLNPYFALAYGLDAEYFTSNPKSGRYLGRNYKYLPLRAREVHALSGILFQEFDRDTNGELNFGYAVDRLGGNGPFVEGRVTHYVAEDVDLQLRGRYGFDTEDIADNNSANVGGYVRWTW